jgi:hypothetical protein
MNQSVFEFKVTDYAGHTSSILIVRSPMWTDFNKWLDDYSYVTDNGGQRVLTKSVEKIILNYKNRTAEKLTRESVVNTRYIH